MLGDDLDKDGWIYALAAYKYYHGDGGSHIMSDSEYDALTNILIINWDQLPYELQKVLESPEAIKVSGMHIKLSKVQESLAQRMFSEKYWKDK